MNTPINNGLLQSDLDCAGFDLLNFSGSSGTGGNSLITVNVQDAPYNAIGDGVTDDTEAIQTAIDAVGDLGGGTVFFPKGVYLCNGAFDGTTNSVLKFPYYPIQVGGDFNNPVTIQLLGETPAFVAARPFENGSTIKSTKAGTGTLPSILAAYTVIGRTMPGVYTTVFSYIQPVIRNLQFQTGSDPTLHGIRLDSAVNAILEDVVIATADSATSMMRTRSGADTRAYVEPTHGTVGLWMPATTNFATAFCNRVWAMGFDTGMVASCEHFRAPQFHAYNCHVAAEFLSGGHMSWANIMAFHCNSALKFTSVDGTINRCPAVINLDIEYSTSGWQTRTTDVLDSSNSGSGEIRYWVWSILGNDALTVTGGANLRITNTYSAGTTHYIGTDARLVAVSGGVKLEARNTGTGTWVEAARWTNP